MENRLSRYYCDIITKRFGESYVPIFKSITSFENVRFMQLVDCCMELSEISNSDKLKKAQLLSGVRKALQCWMRHSLVTLFKYRGKKIVYYMFEIENLLQIDRQTVYYYLVKTNLGKLDALLLKEIFMYGELGMTDVIMRVYQRCLEDNTTTTSSKKASSSETVPLPTAEELCNAFQRLLEHRLLQRCPKNVVIEVEPVMNESEMALLTTGKAAAKRKALRVERPSYGVSLAADFHLPPFDVRSYVTQKLYELQDAQVKEESTEEPQAKRFKGSGSSAFSVAPDVHIYYRPHYQGLMNLWRDAIIVQSAADRLGSPMATQLLRTLLSKTFQTSLNNKEETGLLSKIQLVRGLPSELRDMTDSEMHESIHYLAHNCKCAYITYDSISNPMYCCPFRAVWKSLIQEMTHRVLAEKYGNEGVRCFRAVETAGKITPARIESVTVLNARDVQFSLLELTRDAFLRKESFPDPQNSARSGEQALFSVNREQLHSLLYEYGCRCAFNLGQRLLAERETHKHLVEKEASVNHILALVDEHLNDVDLTEDDKQELLTQRKAVEERISTGERATLDKYRRVEEKLEVAKQEAVKSLFIVDYYRSCLVKSE